MLKTARHLLLAAVAIAAAPAANAQITLADKGKPKARIVLASETETNRRAATLLQRFVRETSGAELPISGTATAAKTARGTVVIGETTTEARADGFLIDCRDGVLRIKSAGGKGAVYGVCTLLEEYVGVSYLARNCYTLKPSARVAIPQMHKAETPAFGYRQTQSYGTQDAVYYDWFRLKEPSDVFADNLWVHTFDRIMPAAEFGAKHPEYYSYINGQRRPGNHSQWCLTNPEIFDIVVHRVDSIFRANPGKTMMSISQNDGNDTYCQCPECQKVNEYEGSPSGNFIRFLNRLAERFPDKQFSTLAYLFTMNPPRHARPRPNVNIMLCDIDCKREVPLTDNPSGQAFVRALEGWSKISDNIFVWDYCINFDNVVAPFPNFHILKQNINLFHKNHATMLFEQANGTLGTDFAEMRAYMLSKLMWNPTLDDDSLMQTFMREYYGDAAPYLYRYQQIQQGALLSSGTPLWIYDSPISHKQGMLNANLIKTYDRLFDQAERAVGTDSTRLAHVRIARLPLRYSKLEIARTEPSADKTDISAQLDTFEAQCRQYDIPTLNERNNRPADYCQLYRKRFLPTGRVNKAAGAKITWNNPPEEKYRPIADRALTDGLYGGTTYVESWVGWKGEDADFVIDLGQAKTFSSVSADFLHQLGAWILLPKSVSYSYSQDSRTWQKIGTVDFAEDRDPSVKFVEAPARTDKPVTARYVRVQVKTLGLCPPWHYGVGYPAWFFIDEVNVE